MTTIHRARGGSASRALGVAAIAALILAVLPLSLAQAAHLTGVTNLDADDNTESSIVWSSIGAFPQGGLDTGARDPNMALIGRDDIFPDNLASGALQGADGPLLLNSSDTLEDEVADELARLDVDDVTILGEFNAISAGVEAELIALGYNVDRLGGTTRIETAIEITRANGTGTALLGRAFGSGGGDGSAAFADSLAGGGWAALEDYGVLLTQTNELTDSLADYLAEGDIDRVIALGDQGAINDSVLAEIEALGVDTDRVSGVNRAATAVAVAGSRGVPDAAAANGIILVEGYTDDAWADGFPAAATSALESPAEGGYPIVLANGEGLPPETVDFLTPNPDADLVCGTYVTDAACDEAAALLGAQVASNIAQPAFDADSNSVTGTITGDFTSAAFSGDCIADTTVTPADDTDPDSDGTQFSIPVAPGTPDGPCEITVVITQANGRDVTRTFTVDITEAAANPTVTDLPELVRAEIVSTTEDGEQTPTNPVGTVVRYEFDEPVEGAAPDATEFFVTTFDSQRLVGSDVVSSDGNEVLIRFDGIDTDEDAAALTVATVNDGAVTDNQGDTNPEGDAPLGAGRTIETGAAGVTDAPDLTEVDGFRGGALPTTTAVDFTFDENATTTAGATGFGLVPTDGSALISCTGPLPADTGASGGTTPGGNGTTTITVLCAGTVDAAAIARGVVDSGTVADDGGILNQLQTADVSATGNSADPSLVSAQFFPADNEVLYTFDQAVAATPVAALFNFYTDESLSSSGTTATRGTTLEQVLVEFAAGPPDVVDAVGASVDAGAVTGTTGTADDNEPDEVGVDNIQTVTITPGRTTAPDLVSVTVEPEVDNLGAITGVTATYDFDETIDGPVGADLDGSFFLFLADGTRYTGTDCTQAAADDSSVVCETFADDATDPADDADVADAVLGTVNALAVEDSDGNENPEGAEVVTAA